MTIVTESSATLVEMGFGEELSSKKPPFSFMRTPISGGQQIAYQPLQLNADHYPGPRDTSLQAQASADRPKAVSQFLSEPVGEYRMGVSRVFFAPSTCLTRIFQKLPQVPYERGLRKERELPRSDYGNGYNLASALVKDFTHLHDHGVAAFPGATFAQRVSFIFHVREQPQCRKVVTVMYLK